MSAQAPRPTPEEQRSAEEVLQKAPFAFLAMSSSAGPYVVPVNFAYASGRILFHTGAGKKTDALAADARVCVAVTSDETFDQGPSPCKDGYSFRSVLAEGDAHLLENPEEREKALHVIVAKYDPGAAGLPFDEAVLARTLVYAVAIERLSYRHLRRDTA
ncbi:MAG: hypothetical protein A2133_00495 [Actinobacteria bacterium RBG_16_64_13]|nr:MAG: hypothetical protein A2133_00495 [Actinobacteria bacterium RBG_16_64_13]